ncbi:hypothetical protein [Paraburkholderia humisilvae]|uniref:Uncharacterized protein n=1 Tax=Paraburkholderia humisilvae TaxID=627669 RepID=A0A6J5DF43_9BURK|nr:hypothetical protein [Paraburkholderia humisilvae]CAB3751782.1 hypothetical protein LMG29542_01550 [Paraburkholderia humisilvae]
MNVPQNWIQLALSTTGHFEDATHPFSAVTGNFDGMGISVGVLQWNIGSGSLQPLVLGMNPNDVKAMCPNCGDDLLRACEARPSDGLAIVSAWQIGSQLKPPVLADLKALAQSSNFVAQQVKAATHVAQNAYDTASSWYQSWALQLDPQAFCWFFDVYTQNGGLADVTPAQVDSFIGGDSAHAVNTVCTWLSARQAFEHGAKDSIRNATQWKNVSGPPTRLFIASYLRSQKSKLEWRADVLNRKATIAVGNGWVHGENVNLSFNLAAST